VPVPLELLLVALCGLAMLLAAVLQFRRSD
jgi:hypothetical protein